MQLSIIAAIIVAFSRAITPSPGPVEHALARLALITLSGLMFVALATLLTQQVRPAATRGYRTWWPAHFLATLTQATVLGLYLAHVTVTFVCLEYAPIVKHNWNLGRLVIVDDVLILIPITLPLMLAWFTSPENGGARTSPAASCWNRSRARLLFVWAQSRHYLVMPVVPVMLLLGVADTLGLLTPAGVEPWNGLLLVTFVLVLSLSMPWLIRLTWAARSLPPGARRSRLELLLQRARVGVSDILVWRTDNRIVNAATAGIVPGSRYLFLSDGLLRRLGDQQLTAIVAHEAGHVRHRHLFQLFISLAIPLFSLQLLHQLLDQVHFAADYVRPCGSIGILVCWATLHCRLARLLEHQADVAACHIVSATPRLRADAVKTYAETLRAMLGEDSGSDWLHPSQLTRIALLNHLARNVQHEVDFHRQVKCVSLLLVALALTLLGCWVLCI